MPSRCSGIGGTPPRGPSPESGPCRREMQSPASGARRRGCSRRRRGTPPRVPVAGVGGTPSRGASPASGPRRRGCSRRLRSRAAEGVVAGFGAAPPRVQSPASGARRREMQSRRRGTLPGGASPASRHAAEGASPASGACRGGGQSPASGPCRGGGAVAGIGGTPRAHHRHRGRAAEGAVARVSQSVSAFAFAGIGICRGVRHRRHRRAAEQIALAVSASRRGAPCRHRPVSRRSDWLESADSGQRCCEPDPHMVICNRPLQDAVMG
jgi:hypothetical protein